MIWKRLAQSIVYILCGLGIVGCFAALTVVFYLSPPDSSAEIVSVTIAPGTSSHTIAKHLATKKLIRSPLAFQLAARHQGVSHKLRAGTYQLRRNMPLTHILQELQNGQIELQTFTVPEGVTATDVAELWEAAGFGTAEAFRKAMNEPSLFERYRIQADTLEGYLFPDTYKFAKGTTAATVVEMMLAEFDKRWDQTLDEETCDLGLTRHELITLASIIEKEAGTEAECVRIGSVFHNRLKRNWRLQADPTVLYALGNPKRLLTRADLKVESPYNTYQHKGLPPGPIANPGMASILGAIRPEKTDYFYFVAIDNGQHHFSKTLAEHTRTIRRIKRERTASRNR